MPGSVLTHLRGKFLPFPPKELLAAFGRIRHLPIYPTHKVFVSAIKNSIVPFNHEALPPLMRLGAFAIVAEERGFLKLLPCAQAHNSTAVLLRRQFAVIRPIV